MAWQTSQHPKSRANVPIERLHPLPDDDVGGGLDDEEGDDGEEREEGEEVAERLLLDQRGEGTAVADHDDGHGRVPNVHHQVLIVARLGADLRYATMSFHVARARLRLFGSLNLASIRGISEYRTKGTHREDDEDHDELREAEGHPELKRGEGGDHGGPPLPDAEANYVNR